LTETVESVLQGEEVPTELVIVDQSDVPNPVLETLTTDRSCNIRYVRPDSVGLSRARNSGIAASQHDILAIIDDDMFVTHTWFGSLIRALIRGGPRTVVTGRVLATEPEVPGGFVPALAVPVVPAIYEGRIGASVLAGGHMATYRAILDAVGGFDERLGAGSDFPAADDNDLGFRVLEAGYRIMYAPEAVLYHRAWRGKGDYLAMRWNYGRGEGGFYCKYLSLKDAYMLRRMAWDIVRHLIRIPYRLCTNVPKACGDAVYVLGIFLGATQWVWLQRRRVPE
jgi:O-antigen biosynthesis protein